MKFEKIFLRVILACFFLSGTVSAQNFRTAPEQGIAASGGAITLFTNDYRIVQLNQQSISSFLKQLDTLPENAQSIDLPMPDGEMMAFRIWKTPIMERTLQTRYPDIQTFTAVASDDPKITAKIDYTLKGFHAMVYAGTKTFLIDPYHDGTTDHYIVYYKKDFFMPLTKRMVCETGSKEEMAPEGSVKENLAGKLPGMVFKQGGSIKRVYRLALSCTGEYAIAVAGSNPSKADVLSAMVTTMNRVNGIYEREIAVSLTFIGNEDQIIYLDPATDPFSANNNGTMLMGQNQNNLSSVIGSAHYDIGHIFSTGGGGIAELGSVCNDQKKGEGVTGLAQPVGDAFDIDYVAHEMGHQLGANHTFNDCNGYEYAATAFEPGGGSTIMAYAGICGNFNNIQMHSSAYFHAISLTQINDFLTGNSILGNGSTCGTTSTGSQPPALPSIAHHYTIPFETPFEITAPDASTQNPNAIRYCWEQWNLGNFKTDETEGASFISGPSLRSYAPALGKTRVFPVIDSLVRNNTEFAGERLPEVARSLAFKLTARQIRNGWGTFDISDSELSIDVINTGIPFKVTHPDRAPVTWPADSPVIIAWDKAQTDIAPINCSKVNIYLSADGGFTYPYTLAENMPNTGSATVLVPHISTNRARVKVKGAGNIFFDISDNDFSITGGVKVGIKEAYFSQGIQIFPNPATDKLIIKNTSGNKLKLALFNDVGQKVWTGAMAAKKEIALQSFARGLYFLHLEDEVNGARSVRKISLR